MIDARSWGVLAVFMAVIGAVVRPIKGRWTTAHVLLDVTTAPVLGVLLLWATTCITTQQVVDGIAGSDPEFKPYAIVILVFALAYISISLDLTGVLTASAVWAARKSGRSGVRLFAYFYALASIVTVVASNDVVVLTLTPIICYFAAALKIDPMPFLIAEFHAANTWSSVLLIGNPTNLIVGQKYGLGFLEYSAWMVLPGLLSSAASVAMLYALFRRRIPATIAPPPAGLRPQDAIRDKWGAVVGGVVLLLCLVTLAVTSLWHVPVWIATLPFSVVLLVRDVARDAIRRQPRRVARHAAEELQIVVVRPQATGTSSDGSGGEPGNAISDGAIPIEDSSEMLSGGAGSSGSADGDKPMEGGTDSAKDLLLGAEFSPPRSAMLRAVYERFPTAFEGVARMPWKIGPFVFAMFIMVEGLKHVGWVDLLASGLAQVVTRGGADATGSLVTAVFVSGILSALGCCLLNNQPLAIFFANVLTSPGYAGTVTSTVVQGSMFGLILGANMGGNMMLHAALAGLMWDAVLRFHGVRVGFWSFAAYGLVAPVSVAVGCAAVYAEMRVVGVA
nr:hypothetical protein HK105_002953 [Polyrhizophydium stewartii]